MSFPLGEDRFRARFPGWEPLGVTELMQEMELFLSHLGLDRTVFRSDHASNWLVLKGTLGADKPRLLRELRGHRCARGCAAQTRMGARTLETAEALRQTRLRLACSGIASTGRGALRMTRSVVLPRRSSKRS